MRRTLHFLIGGRFYSTMVLLALLNSLPCEQLLAEVRLDFTPVQFPDGHQLRQVNDIKQDGRGFIWFATEFGLFRYDGRELRPYMYSQVSGEGPSSNRIRALGTNGDQGLWVRSDQPGIQYLDFSDDSFRSFLPDTQIVGDPYISPDKTVFLTLLEGGLAMMRDEGDSFQMVTIAGEQADSLRGRRITSIYTADDRDFWLNFEGFAPVRASLSGTAMSISGSLASDDYNLNTFGGAWFQSSSADAGVIMNTWGGGIFRLTDSKKITPILETSGNLPAIKESSVGSKAIWIISSTNQLFRHDFLTGQLRPAEIRNNQAISLDLRSVFVDASGTVWLAHQYGVHTWSSYRYKFNALLSVSASGRQVSVHAVREIDQRTVLVGYDGGLLEYDLENQSAREIQLVLEGERVTLPVYDIEQWNDAGQFVLATGGEGVVLWDRASGAARRLSAPVQILDAAGSSDSGEFWFAALSSGIGIYEDGQSRLILPEISSGPGSEAFSATCVFIDSAEGLWIGTDGSGLLYRKAGEGTFQHLRASPGATDGLSDNRITSIAEGFDGQIWITTHRGLNWIYPESLTVTRPEPDSLLNATALMSVVFESKTYAWLSGYTGLIRYNCNTGNMVTFDSRDGLQSGYFNPAAAYSGSSGMIYFGSPSGFYAFNPSEIRFNTVPPGVEITSVAIQGNPPIHLTSTSSPLRLNYNENRLTFTLGVLDYVIPGKNQFSYRLTGMEDKWVNLGTRHTVTLSGLKPGNYIFELRGKNADGTPSAGSHVLQIIIDPPYWDTAQFRFIAVFMVFSIVWGLYKFRTHAIRRERDSLAVEVARRRTAEGELLTNQHRLRSLASKLTELEQLERKRISSTLHDSIGHSLFLARMRLAELHEALGNEDSRGAVKELSSLVETTLKTTRGLTAEISPPALHKFGLETTVERLVEKLARENDIQVFVRKRTDTKLDYTTSLQLYQSVRELMMNVVKHADATTVQLMFGVEEDRYFVSLMDNGTGFDDDWLHDDEDELRGFGLFSIRERLESVGGGLKINSTLGEGTEVILSVPVKVSGVEKQ